MSSSRRRFLIVIHYFSPHIGGMEEVAKHQAQILAELGHEVTVLTLSPERRLPRREITEDGYTIRRIPALNAIENRFNITFPIPSPTLWWALREEVRRADVVHLHDVFYLSSPLAALAATTSKKPFFLTQHVALVDYPSRFVMAVQRMVYATTGRAMFRKATGIVVYNANVRDFVLGRGVADERLVYKHNGIDTQFFLPVGEVDKLALRKRYGVPPDRPVVLFLGRLVPKKGFQFVVDASSPDHTTLIVGSGSVPGSMSGERDVVFFGPASRDEARDLYRLSDLFVFPTTGEIFTLVMQEAMACGLPVVTSDDPGYAEYDLDRSQIEFIERDQAAVTSAIRSLLASPCRRAAMGRYSRALAEERFSWTSNYHQEYAIYDR